MRGKTGVARDATCMQGPTERFTLAACGSRRLRLSHLDRCILACNHQEIMGRLISACRWGPQAVSSPIISTGRMQGRTEPCDGAQLLMMGGLVGAGAAPPVVEARAGMQQRDMDELGLGNSVGQVSASAQGCAADGARCSEEDKMRLNAHLRTKLQRGSLGQWRTRTSTLQRTDGTAVAVQGLAGGDVPAGCTERRGRWSTGPGGAHQPTHGWTSTSGPVLGRSRRRRAWPEEVTCGD